MDIRAFPIRIEKEEAGRMAKSQGNLLRKIFCRGKSLSEIRLHFIECKLITYEVTHKPNLLDKLFARKPGVKKQLITMLADGSNNSVAWVDTMPGVVSMTDVSEDQVQYTDKDEAYLIKKGRSVALKVVHRHAGGIPEIEQVTVESVFRPYWIAFFGEVIEGKKVHYSPIAADGCNVHKTF
ncbi:hypothetical protein [Sporomusa sp.]|uniref:hypothetical protein n=1 Tax=Sporomusa sp. TaxID=2078658 RepID=UPI002C3F6FFE|nr:hypothetical protein [Sporomusa sp.]HWR07147.1 hypothetical protein [Sporomusa sp.]